MLIRILNHISDSFFSRFSNTIYLAPITTVPNSNAGFSIRDIFGGFMLATPKHRTPLKKIWARRYGDDNWKYGQKLFKSKRNIVTCFECGHFHEIHTICRNCFKKVQEESKRIIDDIQNSWGRGIIDQEVQVLYQGETAKSVPHKRIVELERPRPMWFASNLSQKSANPAKQLGGPFSEIDNRTIKEKHDGEMPPSI